MEDKLSYFVDPNFSFDEDLHLYSYKDPVTGKNQIFQSVTGFIGKFKKEFNSSFWSRKKAIERGVDPSVILAEWKKKGDVAASLGTNVHKWIEDYYNGLDPEVPTDPELLSRVEKFKDIHTEKLSKMTPIRQEFRVFSRKWGLAGTTDAIFKMGDHYYLGDWKTNREFSTDSSGKKFNKMLPPFSDLWENQLNTYSIQLSMYQLILEVESGFKTNGAFLVWIGPDSKPMMYKTVDLRDRLYDYLQKQRKNT